MIDATQWLDANGFGLNSIEEHRGAPIRSENLKPGDVTEEGAILSDEMVPIRFGHIWVNRDQVRPALYYGWSLFYGTVAECGPIYLVGKTKQV